MANDREVRTVRPQLDNRLDPILLRHEYVEYDQVRPDFSPEPRGLRSVLGEKNLVPRNGEQLA